MQYRTCPNTHDELPALGFGCMRFPTSAGRIDVDASEKLILAAVDAGVDYLDTAYLYNGNERALGEIFARNPGLRERVRIATKLPLPRCTSAADLDEYLTRSLERLGTDYVDYYLVHNVGGAEVWARLEDMGFPEWVARQKENGRIRRIGFSYHGPEADFPVLLDAYPWDFCQIQYNYMNEHFQAGTAGLRAAAERGIPVIVMEPLLGGKLAAPLPADAQRALEEAGIPADPVRLALRWPWNKPEVTMVLSGMNTMEQLEENIATADAALPGCLTDAERAAVRDARRAVTASYRVPCTGCNYCMPCPHGVNIPQCFAAYNTSYAYGWVQGVSQYVTASGIMTGDPHLASDCTQCGACVPKCPQRIAIPDELRSVRRRLQVPGMRTILKLGTHLMSR